MAQLKRFCHIRKEHMGCCLKKSIYVFEVDETIRKFGFKENEKDNSVYAKFKNGKFIFHNL